ncbi:MAG TPA: response regulator transcription factor [Clostridiaceae bacterium]|nr:response regulator transcription factor [Clostridiaceae bacterium]
MLSVSIVEDDPICRQQLKDYVLRFEKEQAKNIVISEFSDGVELLQKYNKNLDIILLDIGLPNCNGLEAAKRVRKVDQDVVIIFITNMSQYAVKGYEVDALDFILKPVNYDSFSVRFTRAINRVKKKKKGYVLLNIKNNSVKKIETDQILYIESQKHFLVYHTEKGDFTVRGALKKVEEELSQYNFAECNHWYLVNLQHVSEINDGIAYVGDFKLEISRRKQKSFMEAFTRYMGDSI